MKPILFSTPMVQAIIAGRKTQTRRIIKPQPTHFIANKGATPGLTEWAFDAKDIFARPSIDGDEIKCPYQVNDILWVREKFAPPTAGQLSTAYMYAADFPVNPFVKGIWKPSIHMPKEAARLFLRITDIRVQRLKDITEEDAIAEGVEKYGEGWKAYDVIEKGPHKGKSHPWNAVPYKNAVLSFFSLWQSINGEESLDSDPYVWVYTFERVYWS